MLILLYGMFENVVDRIFFSIGWELVKMYGRESKYKDIRLKIFFLVEEEIKYDSSKSIR